MADNTDSHETENPIQHHYDDRLGGIASAEQTPESGTPETNNDPAEAGFFRNENDDESGRSKRTGQERAQDADGRHNAQSNDSVRTGADLVNPGGALARRFLPFSWSRRKTVTGGIIGLLLGGGVFFGLGVSSGPLQVIHLGEVLHHSFDKNESDSSVRTRHLFRYAKAAKSGNIGETRVGVLGSKVFGTTLKQLSDIGINIETGRTGQPTRTTIDTDKLKKSFPELDNMNDAERKAFIADKLGVRVDTVTGGGGKFAIDQSDMNIRSSRLLAKSSVGLLDDGKIVGSIKARTLTKVLDLPSLFHPFKRASAAVKNKFINGKATNPDEQKQAASDLAEEQKALVETASGDGGAVAVDDAKGKIKSPAALATSALTFVGFACQIRSVANDIVTIDRARVVLPGIAAATSVMAAGSQVKSGQDIAASQVGALVGTFTDAAGGSIWQSKPLQALAGGSTAGLKDLPGSQKQAFRSHSTVNDINGMVDSVTGGHPKLACSGISLFAQGVVGIVIAGVAEIGSLGSATPAVVAAFGAKTAAQMVVAAGAMKLIDDVILSKTTADALSSDAFKGVSGGGLFAYSSRAAANQVALSNAGVELSNNESTLYAANQAAADKRQFESERVFARMFDARDYRSLAGRLADSLSPDMATNIASFASGLTNLGSSLPRMFASFIPSAGAATAAPPYDWGFPQIGIPDELLSDPKLSDPYANADAVAQLFDADCRSGNSIQGCAGTDYIGKVKACFGLDVTLTQDPDSQNYVWDTALAQGSNVDPQSDEYISADCNNLSDQNWRRIIMWANDTADMKAAACYEGDGQSCQDLGAAPSDSPATTQAEDFTVATYNMCQDTNHKCPLESQKATLISSFISGGGGAPQLDIVGAEEVSQPTQTAVMQKLSGYDTFPKQVSVDQGRAVFWNTSKFTLKDSGKLGGIYSNDGNFVSTDAGDHAYPWVALQTASGQTVYVIATHFPNDNGDPGGSKRAKNAQAVLAWAKGKSGGGNTVIITGDFNVSGTRFGQSSPYCILTSDGSLQHGHDMQDGHSPAKSCPTPNPVHYAPLDSIYASTGNQLTASGWTWMGEGGANQNVTGTDHSPSYVTLHFPNNGGSAGGSANIPDTYGPACTGQGGSTYGVACTGQCVDYVEYMLNKTYDSPGKYTSFGTGAAVVSGLITRYGFKPDSTAQVGDVVSWPPYGVPGGKTSSSAGHTAVVIKTSTDGSIVVAEYNWSNDGPINVSGNHSFDTRDVPASVARQLTYAHTNITLN